MPEEMTNSLVNLGDITKPVDTLIKKVSKAVGGLFEPYQIKRVAKAEAEAAIIKAQTEIQITDLHRRAMHRFIEEEAQRQKNIEDITNKALPQLKPEAKPDAMEDDWVTNFFDKSRIVSDCEMQALWSRILAGEANAPGTFSKRTVNFLSDLDKIDAALFTRLLGYSWVIDDSLVPLVFDVQAEVYNRNGINFGSLSHLESIGLIQFGVTGFHCIKLPKRIEVYYHARPLSLEMPNNLDNELNIGHVLLTKIGNELAPICGSNPVDNFWEYVQNELNVYLPKTEPEQGTALNGSPAIPVDNSGSK